MELNATIYFCFFLTGLKRVMHYSVTSFLGFFFSFLHFKKYFHNLVYFRNIHTPPYKVVQFESYTPSEIPVQHFTFNFKQWLLTPHLPPCLECPEIFHGVHAHGYFLKPQIRNKNVENKLFTLYRHQFRKKIYVFILIFAIVQCPYGVNCLARNFD